MDSRTDARNDSMMSTWTRELNASLVALDILLSGIDAASILPQSFLKSPNYYDAFKALSDEAIAAIAANANEYCETDRIGVEEIRSAVKWTLWHWSDPQT